MSTPAVAIQSLEVLLVDHKLRGPAVSTPAVAIQGLEVLVVGRKLEVLP